MFRPTLYANNYYINVYAELVMAAGIEIPLILDSMPPVRQSFAAIRYSSFPQLLLTEWWSQPRPFSTCLPFDTSRI
jgi:hypothetical protein